MTEPHRPWVWRDVQAPAGEVWPLIADTRWWPTWGPSVIAVEPAGDVVAAGLRGRVRTAVGPWLPFVIDEVADGRSWTWTVAGVAHTDHRVDPIDATTSRVGIGVPRLAWPYLAVCSVAVRKIARLAESGAGRPVAP